jgi:hypothetical protein
MPKILVNKLTILAYLAEDPNRNDDRNATIETRMMLCDVE